MHLDITMEIQKYIAEAVGKPTLMEEKCYIQKGTQLADTIAITTSEMGL